MTILRISKVKTIFIIVLRHMCLLHCVDIYTDGAVVMAGKLLSRLAEIKAEAANSTHSHCILHLQAPIIKKNMTIKLRSHLKEATYMISLIKFNPWI